MPHPPSNQSDFFAKRWERSVRFRAGALHGTSRRGAGSFAALADVGLASGGHFAGQGRCGAALVRQFAARYFKARSLLGWVPPVSVSEGLRRAMAPDQKPILNIQDIN